MELIVPNTSVISALYVLNCFEHFRQISCKRSWEIAIPTIVAEELSKHRGYLSFRKEIPLETFNVDKNSLDQMKNRFPVLADGELAVLFVTLNFRNFKKEANSASAILDDKAARNVAKRLGVRYFGTLKLLSELLREGLMTKLQFKQYIKKLQDSGFYFNERILIEIVGKDS